MTPHQLESILEDDFQWRRAEINAASLITQQQIAFSLEQRVLLRAFVPIAYAHWEGFVKFSSQQYMYFVRDNSTTFRGLKKNFLWAMARNETRKFFGSLKPPHEHNDIVEAVIRAYDTMDPALFDDLIDTESNLSERVFEKICSIVGLEPKTTRCDYVYLAKDLLGKRNRVAHGEALFIKLKDLPKFRERTTTAMSEFKYDLMVLAATSAHLAAV